MPRYLTLFCWLIGLPSISMFKELFIFFWWGWNITKCVLAILREFVGTKIQNYCLKSVCHFKVTRFYLILLYKQHNWTLGTYSVEIITHKSQRSNSKFVKDQWHVSRDFRIHACLLLASSFGKKGTFLGIIILIFFACALSHYRVMTGWYVTLKYQAKPRTIARKVFATLTWLDSTQFCFANNIIGV